MVDSMSEQFDSRDDWEKLFDHQFLRWFDLNDYPALVKITKAEQQELTLRGGAKKKAGVLTLQQVQGKIDKSPLLMVLNRTNSESIVAQHGRKPSKWIGQEIVLFQDVTKLKGETVPCIRIRPPKETQ